MSTMKKDKIESYASELYQALKAVKPVAPLTEREQDMTIEDAYSISTKLVQIRTSNGERIIGKKIGVTSNAVQKMLNVHQPDFGYLTDQMVVESGNTIHITRDMIQPRAEGEIAFVLKDGLLESGVTAADVLRATDFVLPCFEIVDSRIQDWKIKIQDTVADNASCGYFVLGGQAADPRTLDLSTCGMVLEKNGTVVATGAGAAALGSPLHCVAWLANIMADLGTPLEGGEVILSGSLVPLIPVVSGDFMTVQIGGIGSASVRFE